MGNLELSSSPVPSPPLQEPDATSRQPEVNTAPRQHRHSSSNLDDLRSDSSFDRRLTELYLKELRNYPSQPHEPREVIEMETFKVMSGEPDDDENVEGDIYPSSPGVVPQEMNTVKSIPQVSTKQNLVQGLYPCIKKELLQN